MLFMATSTVQVRDGQGRALDVALDAGARLVGRVREAELAIHGIVAHGEREDALRRKHDVAKLGRLVTRRALPVHALPHVVTAPAIGRVLDQTNAVPRLHRMAVHALEPRVPVMPKRRVGDLSAGRSCRKEVSGLDGWGPPEQEEAEDEKSRD
jgi:hypothetical protein